MCVIVKAWEWPSTATEVERVPPTPAPKSFDQVLIVDGSTPKIHNNISTQLGQM